MFYLWEIPDDYPEKLIGEYDDNRSLDRYLWRRGEAIDDTAKVVINFSVSKSKLKNRNDLANSSMIPLISERLANVLQKHCAEHIQLVTAETVCSNGNLDGYFLLNVTNRIHAIDRNLSEFTCVKGTNYIMKLKKLIVLPGALGDNHIGRDIDYSSYLYISEYLREVLLAEKILDIGLTMLP